VRPWKPDVQLQDLLNGVFEDHVSSYTIVDCRFDYEHNGGHIPGSVNLSTNEAIEAAFLNKSAPAPSRSKDAGAKHILVFHCEFSVKRAPTL
jgi:M-phase inducer tyrosine phosphatase